MSHSAPLAECLRLGCRRPRQAVLRDDLRSARYARCRVGGRGRRCRAQLRFRFWGGLDPATGTCHRARPSGLRPPPCGHCASHADRTRLLIFQLRFLSRRSASATRRPPSSSRSPTRSSSSARWPQTRSTAGRARSWSCRPADHAALAKAATAIVGPPGRRNRDGGLSARSVASVLGVGRIARRECCPGMFDSGWLKDLMIVLATAGVLVPLLGWAADRYRPGLPRRRAGARAGRPRPPRRRRAVAWPVDALRSGSCRAVRRAWRPLSPLPDRAGVLVRSPVVHAPYWCSARARRSSRSRRSLSWRRLSGSRGASPPRWSCRSRLRFPQRRSARRCSSRRAASQRQPGGCRGRCSGFQDLMVVPVVIVVDLLAGDSTALPGAIGRAVAFAIAGVAIIVVAGRFVVGPLMRLAAGTGTRETTVAIAMFLAIGTAFLTASLGLSAALGAFLAGILLGDRWTSARRGSSARRRVGRARRSVETPPRCPRPLRRWVRRTTSRGFPSDCR